VKRIGRFVCVVVCGGLVIGCGTTASEVAVSQVASSKPTAATDVAAKPPAQTYQVRKAIAKAAEDAPVAVEGPSIPQVFLTSEHSALCRVHTGDQLPAISLAQLSGGNAELAKLQGKQATVVLFWGDDPWMSQEALADLARLGASEGVAIVGIAVKLPNDEVQTAAEKAEVKFPILLDADGKAFNLVGMVKMPRIYVLNEAGEIMWFDIEYSQATGRELEQTLAVLAGK
jgi:peroxiredoxin